MASPPSEANTPLLRYRYDGRLAHEIDESMVTCLARRERIDGRGPREERERTESHFMCATLVRWLEHGIISREGLCIVLVRVEIDASVRRAMNYPQIREFSDETGHGTRAMLSRYAELAQCHARHLSLPTHEVRYKQLVADPHSVVEGLAPFLGVTSRRRIRAAIRKVGRKRALFKYYLHCYAGRLPLKVLRIVTGQEYRRSGSILGRPRRPPQS